MRLSRPRRRPCAARCRGRACVAWRRRTSRARRSPTRGASWRRSTPRACGDGRRARRGIARPEAEAIARAYRDALAAISEDGLDANISIKLTGFGLKLDEALCRELVFGLVADAGERGTFVRLDMEDSSTTDATLELYRALRAAGHDRSRGRPAGGAAADALGHRGARPARAERAPLQGDLRGAAVAGLPGLRRGAGRASSRCLDALFESAGRVAIATHDEWLIEQALERVGGVEPGRYELQMLLGVRAERARQLVAGSRTAADLRAVRRAVVRVLAPPSPGEPEGRRLRREGRPRPPARALAYSFGREAGRSGIRR